MKVLYSWLADFLPPGALKAPTEVADILTLGGLEVESLEQTGGPKGGLAGVVVGHVQAVVQHPNADRLRLCTVDLGTETPVQIVCGAANVAAGQRVPVATVGTTLYDETGAPFKIKKGKLRGEVSMGMICAEDELGLGTDHAGIMVLDTAAAPGTPLAKVLELNEDWVLEIGLTPNRTDALGHYGVARDYAALTHAAFHLPEIKLPEIEASCPITVHVDVPERCPRYAGRVIQGLTVGESPAWLKKRLEAIGQRSINNVVDVTNYVLQGLGQPLHAFDLAKINGKVIHVRTHPAGTPFTTLDGVERKLDADDLLISNAEAPMCLAGVFGGADSGTTANTTAIFLESAVFETSGVRRTSRRHGLHTDSGYRFERGVDPHLVMSALDYATQLILEIAGGEATQAIDIAQSDFPHLKVNYSYTKTLKISGFSIPEQTVDNIFHRLEIAVEKHGDGTATLHVPPYRQDVTRQQDIDEEILRVYGFNNVPPAESVDALPSGLDFDASGHHLRERIADLLTANGLSETIANSLRPTREITESAVPMLNPLSEENAVLRTDLLPGLLEAVAHNLNRQQENVQLYEFGTVYRSTANGYTENERLGIVLAGNSSPADWRGKPRAVDLFDLRACIERIAAALCSPAQFTELANDDTLAFGLQWIFKKQRLGALGQVKPALAAQYGVKVPVFYADLNWDTLLKKHTQRPKTEFKPIPKFPAVRRDISLELSPQVKYTELEATIRATNPQLIENVELFDRYTQLAGGKKSYAITLTFLDTEKTLTDDRVDQAMEKVFVALERDGQVTVRR